MTPHSEHGASGCKRWWNCPGSVALSRGIPNRSSIYAAEGTAAHALAEMCLTNGQAAEEYVGRTVEGFNVDADMAEAVQVYLDQCRMILKTSADIQYRVEHRFSLDTLNPPAPMFGTADFVAWYGAWLWVIDLKYGQGVQVEAEGNPQLKYYALGALLTTPPGVRFVSAMIVQPRAPGGPAVRTAHLDTEELVTWSLDLTEHVEATLRPDAALQPGEWCRFCPAAGTCPAQAREALAVAHVEFDALDAAPISPPEPRLLTLPQLSAALALADRLTDWIKDVRTVATANPPPGWKLVPTQARQSWADPAEAEASLDLFHDLGDARFAPREIVSPAVARRLIAEAVRGDHPTKKAAEAAARDALAPLIRSASSGVTLAPDADPRPALPAAGVEFDALPAPVNQ